MLKQIASHILFLLAFIVTLASANAAQAWFPERKDLETMSLRTAVIIDGVTLLIVATSVYFIVRFAIG